MLYSIGAVPKEIISPNNLIRSILMNGLSHVHMKLFIPSLMYGYTFREEYKNMSTNSPQTFHMRITCCIHHFTTYVQEVKILWQDVPFHLKYLGSKLPLSYVCRQIEHRCKKCEALITVVSYRGICNNTKLTRFLIRFIFSAAILESLTQRQHRQF